MELKNRRVAVRIDDAQLAWQLSDLLMKNGAVVHRAKDAEELRLFVDRLGVEVVIAEARPDRSRLN
jgi:DNA-binding NtrC family response regulator